MSTLTELSPFSETTTYPSLDESHLDELWASLATQSPLVDDVLSERFETNIPRHRGLNARSPAAAPSTSDDLSCEQELQAMASPDLHGLLLSDILSQGGCIPDHEARDCWTRQTHRAPAPPSPPITDMASSIDSPPFVTDFDPISPVDDRPPENAGLRVKRTKRLHGFLDSFRHMPVPNLHAHNVLIAELQDAAAGGMASVAPSSPTRLAAVLEKLGGDAGGARAFVYGLLSWEVFRREEERTSRTARLSSIAASKAANKQMVETLHRRAKTRDWARDGRKAAKMTFDALRRHGAAERSMALLLLAATVSLDGMLKIAHFPVTRAGFAASFAQIVESKVELWRSLAAQGYRTFDYEQLLRSRGSIQEG